MLPLSFRWTWRCRAIHVVDRVGLTRCDSRRSLGHWQGGHNLREADLQYIATDKWEQLSENTVRVFMETEHLFIIVPHPPWNGQFSYVAQDLIYIVSCVAHAVQSRIGAVIRSPFLDVEKHGIYNEGRFCCRDAHFVDSACLLVEMPFNLPRTVPSWDSSED